MRFLYVSGARRVSGLTQIELMIALAVSAVVMVGVASAIANFTQQSHRMSERVNKNVESRQANQTMMQAIEAAGISVQYLHLPVKVGPDCTAEQPCVRELINGNQFQNFDGAALGLNPKPASIEFFRDHDGGALAGGDIATAPAFEMTNPVVHQATQGLNLPDATYQKNYYTTWPLVVKGDVTQSTNPITFLRRTKNDDYFTMNGRFNTWDAAIGTPPKYYLFFGSRPGIPLTQLVGSVMLVYNGSNPNHYTFQMVEEVIDCSAAGGNSPCVPYANAYQLVDDTGAALDFTQPPLSDELKKCYAFVMSAMDTEGTLTQFVPSSATLGITPISWNRPITAGMSQAAGFYLFPTLGASIYGDTNGFLRPTLLPAPSNTTIDLRLFDRYLKGIGTQGQLMAMPVNLISYYLNFNAATSKTSLHARSYRRNFNQDLSLMDDLTGDVIFARRLGTQEISIFVYEIK